MAAFAGRVARAGVATQFEGVSSGAAAAARGPDTSINWEDFNYPCAREPCNLLHFDLNELKEKQGARVHSQVRLVHMWWLLSMGTLLLNCASAAAL